MENDECGFRAEYAKSDRSMCKACRSNIGKDSLRLAIMVQSPNFDGKVSFLPPRRRRTTQRCMFRFPIGTTWDVSLRKSNQTMFRLSKDSTIFVGMIKKHFERKSMEHRRLHRPRRRRKTQINQVRHQRRPSIRELTLLSVVVDGCDFAVEYAKSNRSTCRSCSTKIDKDLVRISTEMADPETYVSNVSWYHLDCFKDDKDKLNFHGTAET